MYLKQNVLIEPLVNQWYAWNLLITPHGLGMVLANYHKKIMESYIRSPMMHTKAVKNPKMIGGPFMDLEGDQTAVVQALLERTLAQNSDVIALAEAIAETDKILLEEAKGQTLAPIYARVPEALKGFVELGYDLNNQPSQRFLERFLYQSPLYQRDRQSLALQQVAGDDRAFVLSTPRFPSPTQLHVPMAFDDPAIDTLFSMREQPRSLAELDAWLPPDPAEQRFFKSLFTEEAPTLTGRDRDQIEGGMRVKYFGHATLLVESPEVSILTDPIVSYEVPDPAAVPRYTYADLPETIDYVVITHGHQDHIMFETLLQLRHKIGTIVVPRSNGGTLQDPSLKLVLEYTGFKNVIELDEMERLPVPGGAITGLPFLGEHGDLHIRAKLGYHIRLNERAVVCVADANNLEPKMYDMARKTLGPIDQLYVGMECAGAPMSWLYGPLMNKPLPRSQDQARRLDGSDCEKAMRLIESLDPKSVYVYAMGQEPWLTFISSIAYTETSKPIVESNQLVARCREKGLISERLFGCKQIAF
ncbi:MBL fold metallo-hydrolase [Acanthopleuribacter pedis]|uniref:MBL fold metallo-hydrolase n=1 Tax=Acanthopleuribacter pedis TaxID=442870 RepID=A0A8J7Q864_9BACT|nr:MBL fold metallo-hydrolase [Acanthopleuribacter pedis]MBO1317342.1 MBL fold metallo-hydrolase [Acanthopleuribacter pedis]MBO1318649.1 MBL fold metallo-hydrolase [Acanthopleuribacter pedis]